MIKLLVVLVLVCDMLPASADARSRHLTMEQFDAYARVHLRRYRHYKQRHRDSVGIPEPDVPKVPIPSFLRGFPPIQLPCMNGTVLLDSYAGALSTYDRSPTARCMTLFQGEPDA